VFIDRPKDDVSSGRNPWQLGGKMRQSQAVAIGQVQDD
jgi:hypothetical protein